MRKGEPKIELLIKFLHASDGAFLEMDHSIDPATQMYLSKVYDNYELIQEELGQETNTDVIANAYKKLYDVIRIDGFDSKLYYDLSEYIWNLRRSNMDICRKKIDNPDFVADMRRVKILLNQYRGERDDDN